MNSEDTHKKVILRSFFRQKRDEMTNVRWTQNCVGIHSIIADQEWYKSAQSIHCYVSMNHRNEVDTHALIEGILASKKRLVVPIMVDKARLQHSVLTDWNQLTSNEWGVMEPKTLHLISPESMDVVLVPMLAMDVYGNRLGYGAGYYDSFLKDLPRSTCKIGLVFHDFVVQKLPANSWDIPLDGYVTERGFFRCNQYHEFSYTES